MATPTPAATTACLPLMKNNLVFLQAHTHTHTYGVRKRDHEWREFSAERLLIIRK